MEVKEEHKEHVKLEPTSGDVHRKGDDDDDQKPFFSFLEFPITQIKVETCEIKDEINEMETTGSEESLAHHEIGATDHSPLNLELLKGTMGLVKEEAEEMYEEGSSGALSELSYSEIKCQDEIKEERVVIEPKYEEISNDDESSSVALMDTPVMKIDHQDETCLIKKEKEELIDMEPMYEDISIDEKSTNLPLLNLVPIMKNEDQLFQANSLGDTTLLIRDIKERSTCQGIELIRGEKEESQDIPCLFYGDTMTGISKSLFQESNIEGDSCVPRVCTENYDSNVGVEQHDLGQNVEDSMNNTFLCGFCDRSFHNQNGLSKHTLTHDKRNTFSCEQCCKSFSNKSDLILHLHTHTGKRPFVSEDCNRSFSGASHLKVHICTHTGERPFVCEHCNKTFSEARDLKTHLRTHAGECTFVCEYCSKSFSQASNLKVHIRTHTDERPFICEYCSKSCSTKAGIERHIRTHTGERPFVCEHCNKTFSHGGHFKEHIRTHTGERPFVCVYCNKSFSRASHLKVHIRTHTGERPFVCKYCNKSFSQARQLKVHIFKHL